MTKPKTEKPADETAKDEVPYSRTYYLKTRKDRLAEHRKKWKADPDFRKAALDRAKEERAAVRASKAQDKFQAMIERAKGDLEKHNKKLKRQRKRPYGLRKVSLTGKAADLVEVYPSGTFATAIGRKTDTIRDWIKAKVLPGASIFLGGKAYFTERFIQAVYRACEQLYFKDGNGRLEILRALVLTELANARESYIPAGGSERVWLKPSDAPPTS
jgi:hypothetical protein